MFTPEKMLHVNILSLSEEIPDLTRTLVREGYLHIIDLRKSFTDSPESFSIKEDTCSDEDCKRISNKAASLLKQMNLPVRTLDDEQMKDILDLDTAELIENSSREMEDIQGELNRILLERKNLEKNISELDFISEEMHLLNKNGLSFQDIAEIEHLFVAYGIIDTSSFFTLKEDLRGHLYEMISRSLRIRGTTILLIGDKDDETHFEDSLAKAHFVHHKIPERFQTSFEDGLDLVEMELWQLRDNLAELTRRFRTLKKEWAKKLNWTRIALNIHAMLLSSMENFGKAGQTRIISGFIPESRHDELVRCLETDLPRQHNVEIEPAENIKKPVVPTKLKNISIFRPFELLTKIYGLPGYNDVDPTPFLAISFMVMFGMMFGDVGHGSVLSLFGLAMAMVPFPFLAPFRDLGKILFLAGLASVGFGFLYGSVFGIEDDAVLQPLWMRPAHGENLVIFLGAAFVLGALIISLGIVLNIIQSLNHKNKAEAYTGEWSVASLIFYWMLLLTLIFWTLKKNLPIPLFVLVAVLLLPILIIVAGQLYIKKEDADPAKIFFEPVEIIMNLFTNSLSFLRIAAFGLAHAALSMTTFIIAEMVPGSTDDLITVPLEHLLIIMLEGMIVTIQCMRLIYYEFFSKFFKGGGVEYSPLCISKK